MERARQKAARREKNRLVQAMEKQVIEILTPILFTPNEQEQKI